MVVHSKGNEVAKIDASRPPEGWDFTAWHEFLKGLAPLLANESDAKWAVGDYIVNRVGQSHPDGIGRGGTGNGAKAVCAGVSNE